MRPKIAAYVQYGTHIEELKGYLINSMSCNTIEKPNNRPDAYSFDNKYIAAIDFLRQLNISITDITNKELQLPPLLTNVNQFKWSLCSNLISFITTKNILVINNIDLNINFSKESVEACQLPEDIDEIKMHWSPSGKYLALLNDTVYLIFDQTTKSFKKEIGKREDKYIDPVTQKEQVGFKKFSHLIWSSDSELFAINYANNSGYEIFKNKNGYWNSIFYNESPSTSIGFLQDNNYHIQAEYSDKALPIMNIISLNNTALRYRLGINPMNFKATINNDKLIFEKLTFNHKVLIQELNLSNAPRIIHYFSNPIPLAELLLLQSIALAKNQEKKYTLNSFFKSLFIELGKHINEETSVLLRHTLEQFVQQS